MIRLSASEAPIFQAHRMPQAKRRPIILLVLGTELMVCRSSSRNCSNNFGPYQFPEKLVPLTILNALEGKPIGIYGQGGRISEIGFMLRIMFAL